MSANQPEEQQQVKAAAAVESVDVEETNILLTSCLAFHVSLFL